jgi:hypothetical protein
MTLPLRIRPSFSRTQNRQTETKKDVARVKRNRQKQRKTWPDSKETDRNKKRRCQSQKKQTETRKDGEEFKKRKGKQTKT